MNVMTPHYWIIKAAILSLSTFGPSPIYNSVRNEEDVRMGIGELLTNRLLMYGGLRMNFTEFKVKKNPNCEHYGRLTGKE